jgi:predicted methyltransferase
MRKLIAVCAAALLLSGGAAIAAAGFPSYITAAVATPTRPDADRQRDANRAPAEIMAFAGIKPGVKVVDFWQGGGYFTRLFSAAVGPTGKVYAITPRELEAKFGDRVTQSIAKLNADANTPNVKAELQPVAQFAPPEPVDVVFTMQNYHDLHARFMEGTDVMAFNRAVYRALKPGGLYIVGDHAATEGQPVTTSETLHRIDPAIVRREIEAAGFEYVGSLDALRRADDPHTAEIHETGQHDNTDRFILKFRKPRH